MKIRSILSKINFELGRNPIIENNKNSHQYIPKPFKAVVLFSADFELAWAWRYSKASKDSLKRAIKKAQQARKNIPSILDLCEEYNIPITWATVGHLFLNKCTPEKEKKHPEIKQLSHFENKYWKFNSDDWFEYDPCSSYLESPEWYAPDLIQKILFSNVKHEIGCHTFSHIDCRDEICSKEIFDSEINQCIELAKQSNISLKTFVHPGHTIGNVKQLTKHGFTSFRTDYKNTLGYPVKHENNLWELKNTMELTWRNEWSAKYHIYKYKKIISRAIKTNTVCTFWFHPSMDSRFMYEVLPEIFKFIQEKRNNISVSTTTAYIDFLNQKISHEQ